MDACLCIGLGDQIISKSFLLGVDGTVNVTLDSGLLSLRGGAKFGPFIEAFSRLVFSDKKFVFKGLQKGAVIGYSHFLNMGLKPTPLPVQDQLCDGGRAFEYPYACVYTKVRGYELAEFRKGRELMRQALRALSKRMPLIVIGEREVELNSEYKSLGTSVYSIYNDVKDLPGVIDATVQGFGLTVPILSKLMSDCAYMRHAQATINIGNGGNVHVSSAVGKTIALYSPATWPIIPEAYGGRMGVHMSIDSFAKAIAELK